MENSPYQNLQNNKNKFGRIFTFVDFGNVNYWYEHDERDGDNKELATGEKAANIFICRNAILTWKCALMPFAWQITTILFVFFPVIRILLRSRTIYAELKTKK